MKTNCVVCNKIMNVKPSRLKRVKYGITCSKTCFGERQKVQMKGDGNHQKGLKGDLNSSFKSDIRITNYGYRVIRVPNHPFRDHKDFMREHRLIVEQNYTQFKSEYFESIEGRPYLKRTIDVHHKDGNKLNNNPDNLAVMTRSEHTTLHNEEKTIIRNTSDGRIIGVTKLDELLENPEGDNQQPSSMKLL